MLNNAINTAVSGLQSSSLRLAVSANNVANASSTSGGVYNAQQVALQSQPAGGVTASVQPKNPATVSYFNGETLAEQPNVNLEEEIINQQIAGYDFMANLSVICNADEMLGNLLDTTA